MSKEKSGFFNNINNKLLFILTIIYILTIIVVFLFEKFSWLSYKGDIGSTIDCELDNQEDKFRSTRNRFNNFFIKNKFFIYLIFLIVGFFSLLIAWGYNIVLFKNVNEGIDINALPKGYSSKFLMIILNIFIILGIIAGSFYLFSYTPLVLTLVFNIINILIISGIIALFYERFPKFYSIIGLGLTMFLIFTLTAGIQFGLIFGLLGALLGSFIGLSSKSNKSKNLVIQFIVSLITTLPCILIKYFSNFSSGVTNNFNKKNKDSWWLILFFVLLLLIIKLIIPFIYKLIVKQTLPSGNILIDEPISLHNSYNLGKFISKQELIDGNFKEKTFLNYNYALSFWIWIFPQSESTSSAYTKNTQLISISNNVKVFFNNNNIEFWASSTDPVSNEKLKKIFIFKNFKFQKWNNFIINYYGGTLDIFINKKLLSSTPNIIPLNNNNSSTSGSENGIYGGIKNVIYYKDTLTQQQINIINTFS